MYLHIIHAISISYYIGILWITAYEVFSVVQNFCDLIHKCSKLYSRFKISMETIYPYTYVHAYAILAGFSCPQRLALDNGRKYFV
jgi:hypothetical protein